MYKPYIYVKISRTAKGQIYKARYQTPGHEMAIRKTIIFVQTLSFIKPTIKKTVMNVLKHSI
jgi:hypothetical protein